MREYQHFIDNDWIASLSGRNIDRANPAKGNLVSSFSEGNADDVDGAVASARRAFDEGPWPRMTAQERAAVLNRWADLIEAAKDNLVDIEVAEIGKPRRFVEGDIGAAVAFTRHAAAMAAQFHGEAFTNLQPSKTGLVLREPVGVAGVIVPWNFPIEIFAKKVPFALASGCSVVVKPSELTSGSALEVARLSIEAGLPAGVLNIVTGLGSTVGEALTVHPGVNMVSFTGSTAVGKRIIRNSSDPIKRVTVELGGKSANIVFADADLDSAVEGTLFAIFGFQGQCCVAGSRLLLDEDIAGQFLSKLVARVDDLTIGDPEDTTTDIGSLISADHLQKVMGYINRAKSNGVSIITGGGNLCPVSGLTDNFVQPTIFDGVEPESELFTEEVFGPVLSVTRFSDRDTAIQLANRTEYGLANTLWTSDLETAMTCSRRLRSGLVWVNTTLDGAPQLPFGGVKGSGYGRELGNAGFEDFTDLKTVLLSTGPYGPVFSRPAQ